MNTHRLKLYFEDGSIGVNLICPEHGCQPIVSCGSCGRTFGDPASDPCESCAIDEQNAGECWLAQWANAADPSEVLEWMRGEVTIEVNGVWEGDEPLVEVYEPEPDALIGWRAA